MMVPSPCLGPPMRMVLPDASLTWVMRIEDPSRLTLMRNSTRFLYSPTRVISMDLPGWTMTSTDRYPGKIQIHLLQEAIRVETEKRSQVPVDIL